MHIPDGFLNDPKVWISANIISAGIVAYAAKKVNKQLGEKQIPMMGVMGAFVFAAQMLNFPIAAGTSGHFLGGALTTVLLGPWAAILVMTANFIVQCLLFQDGGLTALGANIFNMGIIGCFATHFIYNGIRNIIKDHKGILLGAAVSAWGSVMLAALMTSLEIGISGTIALNLILPAMLGVHALIGIGEAIITTIVISYLLKVREDLVLEIPKM